MSRYLLFSIRFIIITKMIVYLDLSAKGPEDHGKGRCNVGVLKAR